MKFGVPTQNEMPTTTGRLKSKPEVEIRYGGRSFFQTGSSYSSAVDWDIFTKFDTHIQILTFRGYAHYQTAAILKTLMTS